MYRLMTCVVFDGLKFEMRVVFYRYKTLNNCFEVDLKLVGATTLVKHQQIHLYEM